MAAISRPADQQPVALTPKIFLTNTLQGGLIGAGCGAFFAFLCSITPDVSYLQLSMPVTTACGIVSGAVSGAVSRIAHLVLKTKDAHPIYGGILGALGATGASLSVIAMGSPAFPAKEFSLLNEQLSIAISCMVVGALGGIYSHGIAAALFGGAFGSSFGLFMGKMIGLSNPKLGEFVDTGAVIAGLGGIVGVISQD